MIAYKCDECGTEIPMIKKTVHGMEIEVLDCGKLKCEQIQLGQYSLNPNVHLCKSCAKTLSVKLDYALLRFKTEILKGT